MRTGCLLKALIIAACIYIICSIYVVALNWTITCSNNRVRADSYSQDCRDTVPLLAEYDKVSTRDQVDSHKPNKPPAILGLDKLMTSSVYSDKMQVCLFSYLLLCYWNSLFIYNLVARCSNICVNIKNKHK